MRASNLRSVDQGSDADLPLQQELLPSALEQPDSPGSDPAPAECNVQLDDTDPTSEETETTRRVVIADEDVIYGLDQIDERDFAVIVPDWDYADSSESALEMMSAASSKPKQKRRA